MRPLSHIRVLDFGQYLAGPLVGMTLADMGAEVIRIDPPGGPRLKSPASDMLSRGKFAITLDLKNPADQKIATDLAARADVVIENFRPGVMARLGLDAASLRATNPDLVYLSLPGFASTDPDLAGLPAWEAVIAARTGQFTDMGLNRRLMGINPSFSPLSLASAYGAAFGAMSILFALAARPKMGGDLIEVPLASALLEGLVYNCEQIEKYPDRYKSPREVELDRRNEGNLPLNLKFSELEEFLDPFYRTYACADGRGFYVVSCSVKHHPQRVLGTLGLHDLLANLPDFDAYLDQKDWPADWALRNYPVGVQDRHRLSTAMKAAFLTRPAHEWEALFGTAKAPGTAQRTSREWLADPHALGSGLILKLDDPRHGEMAQMGNIAWLGDDPDVTTKSPGPTPDQHRDQILKILQSPARQSTVKPASSSWLDGLSILDLTNVIAGPTIGSTLARFGAKVTHVQPVSPSVDPWNAVVFGLHAQRGKESILLNPGTKHGRIALDRLIAQADVITLNGTDEQRDALGLHPEQLAAINPRLILVQLDAFGGPKRGPKSDHLGYDDLAQAATGVMLRFGGGMDTPEEHAHFGTIDVLTGYCACVALGAALIRLNETGRGGLARASLAAAGNMIQSQFMYDFDTRDPFDEPSGRGVLGWGPYYHCYQAADQWFFWAASENGPATLAAIPELSDLANLDGETLRTSLARQFASKPFAYWQNLLTTGAAAAVPLASLHETRDAALQLESKRNVDITRATFRTIRHDQHPMGRWVDLVAPNAVRSTNADIFIPTAAAKYGRDTRKILTSLKFTDTEIDQMIATGAAATGWSNNYLPE